MTSIGQSAEHDAAVIATAADASSCKLSCATIGYFDDPFVRFFVKTPARRMPLINRGYYARVAAIQTLVTKFLAQHAPVDEDSSSLKTQIVILGAGMDTMFFRMKAAKQLPASCSYFELDFPTVTTQKIMTIKRRKALQQVVGFDSPAAFSAGVSKDVSALSAPGYHLVPCDLRAITDAQQKLEAAGLDRTVPTLFISECVFIYMNAQYSKEWISWAKPYFDDVSFVLYEQILPDDAFGRVMMDNIQARGCDLLSIRDYPTIESQKARFQSQGFEVAECWDMNDVYYKFLDTSERTRREKLEIFDELEEFHLLQAHYCLVVATKTAASPSAQALALAS